MKVLVYILLFIGLILKLKVSNAHFLSIDNQMTQGKLFNGSFTAECQSHSDNIKSSFSRISTAFTFHRLSKDYSLWTELSNTLSGDRCYSAMYSLGGRVRYKITQHNYLFNQIDWLNSKSNIYGNRAIISSGYGYQILNSSFGSLIAEVGPGIRYDNFYRKGRQLRLLIYNLISYQHQLTSNAKFIQNASIFSGSNTMFQSETGLYLTLSKTVTLKILYDIFLDHYPLPPIDRADTKTSIQFSYIM